MKSQKQLKKELIDIIQNNFVHDYFESWQKGVGRLAVVLENKKITKRLKEQEVKDGSVLLRSRNNRI